MIKQLYEKYVKKQKRGYIDLTGAYSERDKPVYFDE